MRGMDYGNSRKNSERVNFWPEYESFEGICHKGKGGGLSWLGMITQRRKMSWICHGLRTLIPDCFPSSCSPFPPSSLANSPGHL